MQSTPIDFTKPLDPSILKDRTALVTGGASGIGLAIATALAQAGCHITITDVQLDNGRKAASTLQAQGLEADFIRADVTSWDDQVSAFAHAAATSPLNNTVDIVVTAAGVRSQYPNMPDPPADSPPRKPPTACLDINLTGTYYSLTLAHHYFARSPAHPAKQILFISSMAGYNQSQSPSLSIDYTASKFGVRGLFHQVRRAEVSSQFGGARFNLLAPFFIATPMVLPEEIQELEAKGWKVATLEDVTLGAMRCLADLDARGRCVVICAGEKNGGVPGSANFDARDEFEEGFGARGIGERRGWFRGQEGMGVEGS